MGRRMWNQGLTLSPRYGNVLYVVDLWQHSVSQMNFLLHGSVWLRSMDSNPSTSCRAHEIMRMMSSVGSQSRVSQMNLLLHGSVWLQSMDSHPSAPCRAYGIKRMM